MTILPRGSACPAAKQAELRMHPGFYRRMVAATVCKDWQAAAQHPGLWRTTTIDLQAELKAAGSPAPAVNWPAVAAWFRKYAPQTERLNLVLDGIALPPSGVQQVCAGHAGAAAAIAVLQGTLRELVAHGRQLPVLRSLLPPLTHCQQLRVLRVHQTPGGFWAVPRVAALSRLPSLTTITASAHNLFLHNYLPLRTRTPQMERLDVTLDCDCCLGLAWPAAIASSAVAPLAAGTLGLGAGSVTPGQQLQQGEGEHEALGGDVCSADDQLMAGVLCMVASMGNMLFDLLGSWERMQQVQPQLQPAAGSQALPPQQQQRQAPLLEMEGGAKGSLRLCCRPAPPGAPHTTATVTTDHLCLLFAREAAAAASGAGAGGAAAPTLLRLMESYVNVEGAQRAFGLHQAITGA